VTAISGHAAPYPSGRGQGGAAFDSPDWATIHRRPIGAAIVALVASNFGPEDARARVVFWVDEVDLSG
jgi:hypothetical protein